MLCRYNVLHTEVKTLDLGGSFRYVVGSLLFVVLCYEQREFRVAGRAALVVEDGEDLTACYAIEPASVNISRCYCLWHVCLLHWQSAVSNQQSVSVGNRSSLLQRIANCYFSMPVGSPRVRVSLFWRWHAGWQHRVRWYPGCRSSHRWQTRKRTTDRLESQASDGRRSMPSGCQCR